jgi:hypothetical protein
VEVVHFQSLEPTRIQYPPSHFRADSSYPYTKRVKFFAARFAEVAKNIDGVLVDQLAQLKKRLVWLQINIGNLLSDLLGAGEALPAGPCPVPATTRVTGSFGRTKNLFPM